MDNQKRKPMPDPARMAEIRKNVLAFHSRRLRRERLLHAGLFCCAILISLLSLWKLLRNRHPADLDI